MFSFRKFMRAHVLTVCAARCSLVPAPQVAERLGELSTGKVSPINPRRSDTFMLCAISVVCSARHVVIRLTRAIR